MCCHFAVSLNTLEIYERQNESRGCPKRSKFLGIPRKSTLKMLIQGILRMTPSETHLFRHPLRQLKNRLDSRRFFNTFKQVCAWGLREASTSLPQEIHGRGFSTDSCHNRRRKPVWERMSNEIDF